MRCWKAKGSLTVEAALVVPLVLFFILLVLNQGLELYEEVVETVEKQEVWEDSDPAGRFRKFELLEKVTDLDCEVHKGLSYPWERNGEKYGSNIQKEPA